MTHTRARYFLSRPANRCLRVFALALFVLLTCTVDAADVAPPRLLMLRGMIALGDGETVRAATDLRHAAHLYPEDWRCQLAYGQALMLAGERALAKGQLRRTALLAPSRLETWQALIAAGRAMKDPALEMSGLTGCMRFMPENPVLQQQMAEACRRAGQRDLATRYDAAWQARLPLLRLDATYSVMDRPATTQELRALADVSPRNPAVLAALAAAEWRLGGRDTTLEILRKLITITPNDPTTIGNFAHLSLLTGHTDEALRTLAGGTSLGNAVLDRALAFWSIGTGKYADAIPPLQRLLLSNPVDESMNRLLGVAAKFAGQPDIALSALRIAWMKDHGPLSGQLYAELLNDAGRTQEAEDVLLRVIELSPQETMPKVALALLYRDTGRLPLTANLTADLIKTRPETVELTILAAERFLQAGFVGRVHELACTLRDNYPGDLVALHGATYLFERLAADADARLVWTRFLNPNQRSPFPWADTLLAVARNAIENNRFDEATSALGEVLRGVPDNREAYALMGKVKMQQGRWADAAELYRLALIRWPDDPAFILAQAQAATRRGDYLLAVSKYQLLAQMQNTAEAWLALGDVYHLQGVEERARGAWRSAQDRPGGAVRARLSLLGSYQRAGDTVLAASTLDEVLTALTAERAAHLAHWRTVLAARGIVATDDELNALLLIAPDLTDPAPLQALRAALSPPEAEKKE